MGKCAVRFPKILVLTGFAQVWGSYSDIALAGGSSAQPGRCLDYSGLFWGGGHTALGVRRALGVGGSCKGFCCGVFFLSFCLSRQSRGRSGGTQGVWLVLRAVFLFLDPHLFVWKSHTEWNDGREARVLIPRPRYQRGFSVFSVCCSISMAPRCGACVTPRSPALPYGALRGRGEAVRTAAEPRPVSLPALS